MGSISTAMAVFRAALLAAVVASASAFSAGPALPLRANARAAVAKGPRMQYSTVPTPEGTKETYWETKAPSSEVLGIGKDIPAASYAAASVVAAAIGSYSTAQVWPLTQNLNGLFLAGSFLLPYSWALHVACWIQ